MKKTLSIFGMAAAFVLIALVKAAPAQADSVYLDIFDVSCNADTDTISVSVIADAGPYELPVVLIRYQNLDGTLDREFATGLFYGYWEDTSNWHVLDEDLKPDDDIVVTARMDSNDGNHLILAWDAEQVECSGFQAPGGGYKTPEEPEEAGFRPQFYFPMPR